MFAPKNVELEDNDPMVSLFQRYNMCLLSIPYATSMLFPTLNRLCFSSKELVTQICLVSRNLPCWVLGSLEMQITTCVCCPCCSMCLLSNLLTAPPLSKYTGRCYGKISTHHLWFLGQVNPPDSPETESPLQGSLHSEGSSGSSTGNTHDDFVMIDFVSALISALTSHLWLTQASGASTVANDLRVVFSGGEKDLLFTSWQSQNCKTTDAQNQQIQIRWFFIPLPTTGLGVLSLMPKGNRFQGTALFQVLRKAQILAVL